MEIAITGGAGFIGSYLINSLKKDENNRIRVLIYKRDVNLERVNLIRGDIKEERTLRNLLENADLLIHLAGYFYDDTFNSNVNTTFSLMNGCVKYNVKNVIYASSIAVYGETDYEGSGEDDNCNPRTFYGLSKLLAENIINFFCERYEMNAVVLRLANVYGMYNRKGVIYNLINNIIKNKEVIVNRDGNQKRDFIYIDDAVNCIANVLRYKHKKFNVFNLSSGHGVSINKLLELLEKKIGTKFNVKYNPNVYDEDCLIAKNIKAINGLNLRIRTDLNEGLDRVIDWIKNEQK